MRQKNDCCQSVEIWGTGTPRKEFIFVKDLADATINYAKMFNQLNINTGFDLTIKELALRSLHY